MELALCFDFPSNVFHLDLELLQLLDLLLELLFSCFVGLADLIIDLLALHQLLVLLSESVFELVDVLLLYLQFLVDDPLFEIVGVFE